MGIVLKNVGYDIDGFYRVIDDLSLGIKDKKISFIVGESGSGKSTLLSLIHGDMELTSGEVINENNLKIGILRQNPDDYFFCNTVYEEMLFALKKNKVKDCDKKMLKALKIVGLDESCLFKSPFEISKGEQKKVALAILLAYNPKVLLLDDPFSNLDYVSKKNLIKLIRMMKLRYNKTIIIASSDTDMAFELADIVICLKDGKLVFQGNKFDFFTNVKLLSKSNISVPRLIDFSNLVKVNKNIDIGYRDDINDLMKDIYRFVK